MQVAMHAVEPKSSDINSHIGIVSVDKAQQIQSILCQANDYSVTISSLAQAEMAEIRSNTSASNTCPAGMSELE